MLEGIDIEDAYAGEELGRAEGIHANQPPLIENYPAYTWLKLFFMSIH